MYVLLYTHLDLVIIDKFCKFLLSTDRLSVCVCERVSTVTLCVLIMVSSTPLTFTSISQDTRKVTGRSILIKNTFKSFCSFVH